ncbi:MAG: citrate synthase [Flavobacteriales bacterium]
MGNTRDHIAFAYGGKDIALPLATGTENETAIEIGTLRNATGLVALDVGYKNTASTTSAITFIDGDKGILRYRGYRIETLAEKARFLEVAYLLIFGELPTADQLLKFEQVYSRYASVDEAFKKILDGFPNTAHPMDMLSALTAAWVAFDPQPLDMTDGEQLYRSAAKILAGFPVLVSWIYRKKYGLPFNYANGGLDYAANVMQLMFRMPTAHYESNPIVTAALDKLLILHADHEQNCSTAAVRIVGSAHASLLASISAGVSALSGPLHGGANQAVIEMLQAIKADGGDIEKYIDKAKDKTDPFRLMGFGHRVYKNFDPRAKVIKRYADGVLEKLGVDDPILGIAKKLEAAALADDYFASRKLFPNVDFYSGITYRALGIPVEMFTVMFALGRLPGWIAQWLEMRKDEQPISRPRQVYIGHTQRDFVPLDKR